MVHGIECNRKYLCLMKVGLDFTPRWCSSETDKTTQREVLRAQVVTVIITIVVIIT